MSRCWAALRDRWRSQAMMTLSRWGALGANSVISTGEESAPTREISNSTNSQPRSKRVMPNNFDNSGLSVPSKYNTPPPPERFLSVLFPAN